MEEYKVKVKESEKDWEGLSEKEEEVVEEKEELKEKGRYQYKKVKDE